LVDPSDNLVQSEFKEPKRIMLARIMQILVIVDIIHFDLELVIAFKVVLDHDFGDPSWIEIVMNQFSLADLEP
jgi:hypothetical protein